MLCNARLEPATSGQYLFDLRADREDYRVLVDRKRQRVAKGSLISGGFVSRSSSLLEFFLPHLTGKLFAITNPFGAFAQG